MVDPALGQAATVPSWSSGTSPNRFEGAARAASAGIGRCLRRDRVRAALFGASAEKMRIDRFALLRRVGAGGMGEVFAAYDERLDREVAIKLVGAGQIADGRGDERLLREAKALAQLSHPNVVQVYEAGLFHGRVFIAMELIRGQTIAAWLHELNLAPGRKRTRLVLDAFIAAGRGLEAAHAVGLAHRDVKPENLLIADDGRVRVADFGLARSSASGREAVRAASGEPPRLANVAVTETGALVGTAAYMAPEQLRGQPADARSDQFSFCVALHEALYGTRPFTGSTLDELTRAVPADGALAPRGDIATAIRSAVRRGLAIKPEERFESMTALLAVLEGWPHRRRRRLSLVAVAAVVLATFFAASRTGTQPPVCNTSPAELSSVWNQQRRERVVAAVGRVNHPYAQEAGPLLLAGLSSYSRRWALTHHSACMAHANGHQSAELLDSRMTCLQRRRAALSHAVDQLENIDDASITKSVELVDQLPAIAECDDLERLQTDVPPPSSDVAAAVAELRTRLTGAAALTALGNYAGASELTNSIGAAAGELDYLPLAGEIALAAGRNAMHGGGQDNYTTATTQLREAVQTNLRAKVDEGAVEALARLLWVEAKSDFERALVQVPFALALSERLPEGAFARALLLNNVGTVYLASGDRASARAYFSAAVEMAESNSEQPVELILARQNLAMVSEDSAERERLMHSVAIDLEARLGRNHPLTLNQRLILGLDTTNRQLALQRLSPTCAALRNYPAASSRRSECLFALAMLEQGESSSTGAASQLAAISPALASEQPSQVHIKLADGFADLIAEDHDAASRAFAAAAANLPTTDTWWVARWRAEVEFGSGLADIAMGKRKRGTAALERAVAHYQRYASTRDMAFVRHRLARAQAALAQALEGSRSPENSERIRRLQRANWTWRVAAGEESAGTLNAPFEAPIREVAMELQ